MDILAEPAVESNDGPTPFPQWHHDSPIPADELFAVRGYYAGSFTQQAAQLARAEHEEVVKYPELPRVSAAYLRQILEELAPVVKIMAETNEMASIGSTRRDLDETEYTQVLAPASLVHFAFVALAYLEASEAERTQPMEKTPEEKVADIYWAVMEQLNRVGLDFKALLDYDQQKDGV